MRALVKNYSETKVIETRKRLNLLTKNDEDELTKISKSRIVRLHHSSFVKRYDQASMLNSLEVRVPFLDHRLVKASFEQKEVRMHKEKDI